MAAADPVAAEGRVLDRLGLARDLDGLIARIGRAGVAIRLDQRLRAEQLARRLAENGVDLREPVTLADWLTPLLATSAEAARLIRAEILAVAAPATTGAGAAELAGTVRHRRRLGRVAAVVAVLLVLLALAASVIGWRPVVDTGPAPRPSPTGIAPTPTPTEQPIELVLMRLEYMLLPPLFILVPAGCIAILLLRGAPAGAVLRRMSAAGKRFETLRVPPAAAAIFTQPAARLGAIGLKAPDRVGSGVLDPVATVRATVKQGGAPALRWRTQARMREYVLLCERGGLADHVAPVAAALAERLAGADITFTRYDLDVGSAHVRYAGGKRSGAAVERLQTVRQRHRGARLIVLGAGESFARRLAEGEALAELIGHLETPVMLDLTPRDRWGWRQAWLELQGLALFAADDAGLEEAGRFLAATATERADRRPARIVPGEDPLLARLAGDATRLGSGSAPARREIDLLVRRLRSFVGEGDGMRLLAAIAAFPRITPAITLNLHEVVNGRPLGTELAARLAQLPWLRAGRMPDWLRVAILRALGEAERTELRGRLLLVLERFRAAAEGKPIPPADPARIDLLVEPGVLTRLLADLGLGGGLVGGEGIFLRFLDGAAPEELDQPAGARRLAPGAGRIAGVVALMLTAAVAAVLVPAFLAGFPTLRAGVMTPPILAGSYLLLVWRLWQRLDAPARPGAKLADGALHVIVFAEAMMTPINGGLVGPTAHLLVLALAAFHLLHDFDRPRMVSPQASAPSVKEPIRWLPAGAAGGAVTAIYALLPAEATPAVLMLPNALLVMAGWTAVVGRHLERPGAMADWRDRLLLVLVSGYMVALVLPEAQGDGAMAAGTLFPRISSAAMLAVVLLWARLGAARPWALGTAITSATGVVFGLAGWSNVAYGALLGAIGTRWAPLVRAVTGPLAALRFLAGENARQDSGTGLPGDERMQALNDRWPKA